MSAFTSVFFNSGLNLKETVQLLSKLFRISFVYEEDPPLYEYTGLDFAILLYEDHDLEDDGDLLFTQYQYKITVLNRYGNKLYDYEVRRYLAMYIFQRLIRVHQFPAMVVEEVQLLLDLWGDPTKVPFVKSTQTELVRSKQEHKLPIALLSKDEIYAYISVFFNSGMGMQETISLSELFAISFAFQEDPSFYHYTGLDFSILVYDEHTNEEQKNLRLKQYQYEMRVLNRFVPVPYAYELKKHMALYLFN